MVDPYARPTEVVEQDIRSVMAERAKTAERIRHALENAATLRCLYAAQGSRIEALFQERDRSVPALVYTPEPAPVPPERECTCPMGSDAAMWSPGTQCAVHGGYLPTEENAQ